jgi:hypothetical protein
VGVLLGTLGIILAIGLLSVGLAIVEYRRRFAKLWFHCLRCDHAFARAPHLDFPDACPRCGAADWAK